MAGVTGLEPATSGVTGRRSNQLSYTPRICAARADDYPPSRREVKPAKSLRGADLRFNHQTLSWHAYLPPITGERDR